MHSTCNGGVLSLLDENVSMKRIGTWDTSGMDLGCTDMGFSVLFIFYGVLVITEEKAPYGFMYLFSHTCLKYAFNAS